MCILKIFFYLYKIIFGQDSIFYPLRQHFVLWVSSYRLVKVPHTVPLTIAPSCFSGDRARASSIKAVCPRMRRSICLRCCSASDLPFPRSLHAGRNPRPLLTPADLVGVFLGNRAGSFSCQIWQRVRQDICCFGSLGRSPQMVGAKAMGKKIPQNIESGVGFQNKATNICLMQITAGEIWSLSLAGTTSVPHNTFVKSRPLCSFVIGLKNILFLSRICRHSETFLAPHRSSSLCNLTVCLEDEHRLTTCFRWQLSSLGNPIIQQETQNVTTQRLRLKGPCL